MIRIIEPNKTFRIFWDNFVILLTVIIAFESPIMLIFNKPLTKDYIMFSLFITIIFLIDIAINFNTGYIEREQLVSNRRLISKNYLKTWFFFDVISVVPFELFSLVFPYARMIRVFRLLKLVRFFKLTRITQTIQQIKSKNVINPSILRMVILVFWIILSAHFIACIWIFLGYTSEELTDGENYLRAIYWTMTTITTIGYGDITPKTNPQIVFTIMIQITGAGMYGFIIGNIANLIANIDIAKAQYRETMEKINTFMKYRNIPLPLQSKINNYYNYLWESRRGYDESLVLGQLPAALKTEVSLFLNKEIIQKVPLFKGANTGFIKQIILNLKPMVFTPGDYIVNKGDIGTEMFFISKGFVEVVSEDGKIVYATLTDGQFFGEIALLLSTPRTASIRTQTFCDLYSLDKETFEEILSMYPDFEKEVKELAERRKEELNQLKK